MSTTEDQVLTALRRITRAIDLHSRALEQRHGLTGPQLVLLRLLADGNERSIGELARGASLSQPTVTGIVSRLERRGLARRERSRFDRRRVLVGLTDAGRDAARGAPALLQERFLEGFAALQDWERNLTLASLQRVVHLLEAAGLDAAPILVSGPIEAASGADDHGERGAG